MHALLNDKDLFEKVQVRGTNKHFRGLKVTYPEAFVKSTWQRVLLIRMQGSRLESITKLLEEGFRCVVPVKLKVEGTYVEGQAFVTMGTRSLQREQRCCQERSVQEPP